MQSEQDKRTFGERIARVNVAVLFSVPSKELGGQFLQGVEEVANQTGAKVIYTLMSSQRIRLDYDRPDERDERRPPRRKFSFGGDEGRSE